MRNDFLCIRKHVAYWKERVSQNADNIDYWVNQLVFQTDEESRTIKDRCQICFSTEGLELHHIAGRKHDTRTITVCQNCHRWLSGPQKLWHWRWWLEDQPEAMRRFFFMMGLCDILRLASIKMYDTNYLSLAESFTEDLAKVIREAR